MTNFWTDEATGLVCATHVGPLGNLNGYVAVPESHPWHGVNYNEHLDVSCAEHESEEGWCYDGGITYSGTASFLGVEAGWWFGFDTAHAWDRVPGVWEEGELRGEDYVRAECEKLAAQLSALVASR